MRTIITLVFTLCLIACSPTPGETGAPSAPDAAIVAAVVHDFGSRLQYVSLLAPEAAHQIEVEYAAFATQELIASWKADPLQAPGRLTSSPWPDRIEIDAINMISADVYLVIGRVIEITNAEIDTDNEAASYAVTLTLTRTQGAWLISGYQIIEGP